jgi:hypothetical protein
MRRKFTILRFSEDGLSRVGNVRVNFLGRSSKTKCDESWWRRLLRMAVAVEMYNTGDPELQRDVVAMIEHVFSDRPGTGGFRLSVHRKMTGGR